MTTTACLIALTAGAALALSGVAGAQHLPADVDPSRLRASALPAGPGAPTLASPFLRLRGGAVVVTLACPTGGAGCEGVVRLTDLQDVRRHGEAPVALAAGQQRRVSIAVRRAGRRAPRRFVALATFRAAGDPQPTPVAGVVVRRR